VTMPRESKSRVKSKRRESEERLSKERKDQKAKANATNLS
jgi:hypothetical protein